MKLATIRETRTDRRQHEPAATDTAPRAAAELHKLFELGMRAMRARDDERAYRVFARLCRYDGDDAPPGLLRSARTARDYLDPDRSSEQKAQTLFAFFRPTVFRGYEAEAAGLKYWSRTHE